MKGFTLVLLRGVHFFVLFSVGYCILHGLYGSLFFSESFKRMDSLYGAAVYAVSLCVYLAVVRMGQRVFDWTMHAGS